MTSITCITTITQLRYTHAAWGPNRGCANSEQVHVSPNETLMGGMLGVMFGLGR